MYRAEWCQFLKFLDGVCKQLIKTAMFWQNTDFSGNPLIQK
uniref:Uncharacterized protein n=1 Tax=Rhizophora mucronata TaxID=61149 RepID=A0A2P2P422_RHIMU